MILSNDATEWTWLIDQLGTELARQPGDSKTAIVQRLDEAAGYSDNPEDAALLPAQAGRRKLVDLLIDRLDAESAERTMLNDKFAKSVTRA